MDTAAQPVFYHNHPHDEIYFYIQGHSRIVVEGLDFKPVRGDVLIYPPGFFLPYFMVLYVDKTICSG